MHDIMVSARMMNMNMNLNMVVIVDILGVVDIVDILYRWVHTIIFSKMQHQWRQQD